MTDFAGPISKVAVKKGTEDTASRAVTEEIESFMNYYTRYENAVAYSNTLMVRLDEKASGIEYKNIEVNGQLREYSVYVPKNAEEKFPEGSPVIFVFPGNAQTDRVFMDATAWWEVANDEGIIIVTICEQYNDKATAVSHVDTLEFYRLLREQINKDYKVDATRFYASGQSAGSLSAQAFGYIHPEYFAAIASTSGCGAPEYAGLMLKAGKVKPEQLTGEAPEIPEEDFVQAIRALCRVEEAWVPDEIGSSLYFRPLAIATTPKLGVHASGNYLFCVLASPAGTYYPTGMEPVRIYVEPHYIRAAEGGTGFTKCAGNYAGAALAGDRAEKMGFNQVLWLDGHDRKYVEEMGSMNGFFVIGGELYTAAAAEDHGTILPGVTRRSVIELAKDWGIPVHEGRISIDTITEASRNGRLEEVFATGTAAVVIPIKELNYEGVPYYVGDQGIGPLTQKFYDTLTGIQWGQLPDTKGWMVEI